jgi:hypothetical protein
LLLAKPVQVPSGRNALSGILRSLSSGTGILVWIDQEVLDKEDRLPVPATDEPWLPTIEKTLSGTEYRLQLLSPNLFWIGSPGRLDAARTMYENGLSKIPWADSPVGARLTQDTRMEFIETPLNQVLDFLSDQHDLGFVLLGGDDTPVTITLKGVPLHVGLTVMTQRLQLDWCADRAVIYVGPPNKLERIKQNALPSLRRWARLGIAASDVTRALRSDTRLEFLRTPLSQIADSLAERHRVPIRIAEAQREALLSLNMRGLTLEQGLDVICLKLNVSWDTDGKSIMIGEMPK